MQINLNHFYDDPLHIRTKFGRPSINAVMSKTFCGQTDTQTQADDHKQYVLRLNGEARR